MVHSVQQRLLKELGDELNTLDDKGLLRRLTSIEAVNGPLVRIDDREVVSWCSNDYLGLSTHPALTDAGAKVAAEWGIGARASRLLAGTTRWHTHLEGSLAAWFGTEGAIVYPSGYLANLGTLGALLSSQDAVFVDRLAHASLFDAARSTRATLRVFRHNDPSHAGELLARLTGARRRVIVTEGIFSMDGDCSPLAALVEVAHAHDAMVYVDDAHGAFVLGNAGRGAPEAAGVSPEDILYMGTLGKALGCQGGFVVGPRTLIDFLRNRARTFIYSTALAVPVVAAAVAALRLLNEEPQRRELLRERVQKLQERLRWLHSPAGCWSPSSDSGQALGAALACPPSDLLASHIIPVVVGSSRRALELSQQLWDRGCWVPAIRPPTVPEGTARLRLSITSLHTPAHIDALADALQEALAEERR